MSANRRRRPCSSRKDDPNHSYAGLKYSSILIATASAVLDWLMTSMTKWDNVPPSVRGTRAQGAAAGQRRRRGWAAFRLRTRSIEKKFRSPQVPDDSTWRSDPSSLEERKQESIPASHGRVFTILPSDLVGRASECHQAAGTTRAHRGHAFLLGLLDVLSAISANGDPNIAVGGSFQASRHRERRFEQPHLQPGPAGEDLAGAGRASVHRSIMSAFRHRRRSVALTATSHDARRARPGRPGQWREQRVSTDPSEPWARSTGSRRCAMPCEKPLAQVMAFWAASWLASQKS